MTEQAPKSRRGLFIGLGVAVFLLCCCSATALAVWFGGDTLMQWFNTL